jgi:hypothetical protein
MMFSQPSSLLRIQRDTLHESINVIPHNILLGPNQRAQLQLQTELVLTTSVRFPRQIEADIKGKKST